MSRRRSRFLWWSLVLFSAIVFGFSLTPVEQWPSPLRRAHTRLFAVRMLPPSGVSEDYESEAFCPDPHPTWRSEHQIAGVAIDASPRCHPDQPASVAAFVRGTNRVPPEVLMETDLSADAVVKGDDRDGDGDPDHITLRLEVIELNGRSPDYPGPFPAYAIAPGIYPGMWVFAPKTRGMATEVFGAEKARALLRAPSPVIRVEQGDTLHLVLENSHTLPHTIHLHGVDHPYLDSDGEGNDGVPQISELPVMPGESRRYETTPRHAGTMFYHCHVQPNVHVMMGLQGMLVVEDAAPDNWVQTLNVGGGQVRHRSRAVRAAYDREYDLHYQDMDRELGDITSESNDPRWIAEATNRRYDTTDATPDYFLLNGRSFPFTTRESLVVVNPDERVKLRVLNGGSEGIALHSHGHKVTITHDDGVPRSTGSEITRDVVWIAPAQRADLRLETTDDGLHSYGEGIWLLHDHHARGITTDGINPGGNLSAIVYERFLDESGRPRGQGMDWTPFFSAAYYEKKLPVWGALDPAFAAVQAGSPSRWLLISGGLLCGLLVGALLARKRTRRRIS